MLQENKFKAAIANGNTALGTFLTIDSPHVAELVARQGLEIVVVDMQHSPIDLNTAIQMIQAIGTTNAVPFVRLPSNDPYVIGKMLDAGALGLICPMIETVDDVKAFVEAAKYPPLGNRSYGPFGAQLRYGPNYFQEANQQIILLPMIETAAAAQDVEAIAEVEGISGLFIGPADLSIALGVEKLGDLKDKKMEHVLNNVLEACRNKELISSIFTTQLDSVDPLRELGFDLICYYHDAGLLVRKLQEALNSIKKGFSL